MKNVFYLFCISFLMIFSSCSSDDDSSSSRSTNLLKDVIGPNWSNEYIYDEGNKLARMFHENDFNGDYEYIYSYSGDFITEIEYWYFEDGTWVNQILWSFEYNEGRLSRFNWIDPIYDDNTYWDVSYIDNKIIFVPELGSELESYIYYADTNGNTIKREEFNSSDQLVYRSLYSYDNKNSPTKNILGMAYLGWPWSGPSSGLNNALTANHTTYNELDGSIENESAQSNISEYNDENYPTDVSYYIDGVFEGANTYSYY